MEDPYGILKNAWQLYAIVGILAAATLGYMFSDHYKTRKYEIDKQEITNMNKLEKKFLDNPLKEDS